MTIIVAAGAGGQLVTRFGFKPILAAGMASLSHHWYLRGVRLLRGRRRLAAGASVVALLVGILGPLVTLGVVAARRLARDPSIKSPVTTMRSTPTALDRATTSRAQRAGNRRLRCRSVR